MRRYWEERNPPSMFSGSLLLRLASGIGMLAIVALLIVRMGEPGMWRWLVGDEGRPPERQSAPSPPPIPEAAGPTDEDPDQAEMAREEFQALTDGATILQTVEMVPYGRLVYWVKNQPFERLRRLARSDLLYTHFHDEPDKYRGRLATMDLDIRQAIDAGKIDDTQLYELRGFTSDSWGRPFYLIVVDFPKDMPVGPSINERVKFAGYFLKMQGYQPAEAKPGAPIEKAPLLIGRIEWKPAVAAAKADGTQEWIWGLAMLAVFGLGAAARFIYLKLNPRRRPFSPIAASSPTGESFSIESWLDKPDLNIDEGESNDEDDAPGQGDKDLDEE